MTLNNNQIASLLNEMFAESTGADEIDKLSLQDVIDKGNDPDVIGSKEQFNKKLLNVIVKRWYEDSSYRSAYKDPFFQDAERFGALTEMISIDIPEAQASLAWQDFGPDTAHGQVDTVGTYKIYLPQISTKVYGKSDSWQICVTITGEQWDSAFHNAGELAAYVSRIHMQIDNGIICHLKNMQRANINSFIAEKVNYAGKVGATGVHVVDLVEKYVTEMGDPTAAYTVEDYLSNAKSLVHGSEKIGYYKDLFGEMSTIFNIEGKNRFTPDDRIVLEMLAAFERRFSSVAASSTYHDEYIKMPNFIKVPFWQALGNGEFDDVSAIDIEIADADEVSGVKEVKQGGIVAVLADSWALAHTTVKRREAVKVFEPEDLTNYYSQFVDRYFNNLGMNAVVFVLQDYTPGV